MTNSTLLDKFCAFLSKKDNHDTISIFNKLCKKTHTNSIKALCEKQRFYFRGIILVDKGGIL